ncbi:MAG TPA: hypothetical protein ENG89_01530, partial [Candidatus Moranbacteria bacterium]|nr:hypothetical protein [Candidatus Moranbacteria bacterium]
MFDSSKKRHRLRIIIPGYATFNVYSDIASKTTALGPVSIASSVHEMEGWDVEVIDENNLRCHGPKTESGRADHDFLQRQRPADIIGLYGGLTSTIPRLYEIAAIYKKMGLTTITGGQHFIDENIPEALNAGIDYVIIGEGEETIRDLLLTLEKKGDVSSVAGIAYMQNGEIKYTLHREPITDFSKLPLPNFSLVRYAKIKTYPISRIRGCEMHCEFCTVKGKPRCASPERLMESISFLVETRDARNFFIVD